MGAKGLLVVISAPSGGGKTTIIQRVLATGNGQYRYSISATTRAKRTNEIHGEDYFFLSPKEFEEMRQAGAFVEWAEVHGYYYGTPKKQLDTWLDEGRIVWLDLDVEGGIAIKSRYGEDALLIFIIPPSRDSLVERLQARNTESPDQIEKRLQRYPREMKKAVFYDYKIVNNDLEDTVRTVSKLIRDHITANLEV